MGIADNSNQELKLQLAEKERKQEELQEKYNRLFDLISVSSRLRPAEDDDKHKVSQSSHLLLIVLS